MRYDGEKARVDAIREVQRKLDTVHTKLEQAERMRDLAMVADLKWVE